MMNNHWPVPNANVETHANTDLLLIKTEKENNNSGNIIINNVDASISKEI